MCGRHVGVLRDGFCVFSNYHNTYHALLKLLVSYRPYFFSYGFPSVVGPAFSTPAFSTPAVCSRIFHSCIFSVPSMKCTVAFLAEASGVVASVFGGKNSGSTQNWVSGVIWHQLRDATLWIHARYYVTLLPCNQYYGGQCHSYDRVRAFPDHPLEVLLNI